MLFFSRLNRLMAAIEIKWKMKENHQLMSAKNSGSYNKSINQLKVGYKAEDRRGRNELENCYTLKPERRILIWRNVTSNKSTSFTRWFPYKSLVHSADIGECWTQKSDSLQIL